ncbi:MAG: AMP-binding protein [Gammaproteobacteria bacterium]|nr:AMP-binding protein [Gammaproteobacteria bacterium]
MHKADLSDVRLRTLPALLKLQAEHNPDTPYLVTDTESISFAEAYNTCLSLASALSELGLQKNDHLLLYLHNCPQMALLALAANMLGAVWVPISTDYKGAWLDDAVQRSRPRIIATEAALVERLSVADDTTLICIDPTPAGLLAKPPIAFDSLLNRPANQADFSQIDYGDTCAIVWTSGTTGKSKGVMLSHNGWLRPIIHGASLFYKSQPGDIIFNVLPMYHAGAWTTSVLRALVEGIPVVIEKSFSVSSFWARIEKFQATQSFTLGAMHMFLWNAPEQENDADNTLRVLQAIPIAKELKAPFEKRFGLTLAGSGLGQSECMLITTEAGAEQDIPDNSIGFARPDTLVKVFDDQDREVPIGTVGEIRIQPLEPHIICNGYLDNPAATKQAWRGDWYCTGDLGYQDENGAFFFSDRKKDAIRFAGRNISTMEVESVVRRHSAVADVAAFGITCRELAAEEELKIDVVLKPEHPLRHEELAKFINDNAPYYFVPRYMEFVAELPYTPTNKVQKYVLRERGVSEQTWDINNSEFNVTR